MQEWDSLTFNPSAANIPKMRNTGSSLHVICSYHGPLRTPLECITQPSMYIFTDPSDPLGRYIDSWTPAMGTTSTNTSRMTTSTAPSNGLPTIQQQASTPNGTSISTKNCSLDMANPSGSIHSNSSPTFYRHAPSRKPSYATQYYRLTSKPHAWPASIP
jgi:hypothetical protein